MCGIAGYVRAASDPSPAVILGMTRAMRHRGPDDEGLTLIDVERQKGIDLVTRESAHGLAGTRSFTQIEQSAGLGHHLALGHRRFSIVDTSTAGHQPFWDRQRAVCICFNGEIYNYLEIRRELEALGRQFHTRCDTEVLLEAYLQWGEACFAKFIGFWAVALYDRRQGRLLLCRDRLGQAPLYVARWRGGFYFASEIGAILTASGHDAFPIRQQAVVDFLAHSWRDVHDRTFYEGIETFPAASYAWVNLHSPLSPLNCKRYWTLPAARMTEAEVPIDQAASEFRRRLNDAVKLRLRADVPIGFELSGGLDSSSLVAAAAEQGCRVHAYTVSFANSDFDEEPFARLVRDRYRSLVDYTVLEPPADDFWQQADEYVAAMGEPFHAPNMLANRGIWRQMASGGIRVSINGAAGDESWAGYFNDYYDPFLRNLAERGQWRRLIANSRLFGDRPHGWTSRIFLNRLLNAVAPRDCNGDGSSGALATSSPGSRSWSISAERSPIRAFCAASAGPRADLEGRLLDYMGDWRMNYWMRSGHQSFMSVPTEVRCPYLDHRLVELAFTLPVTYLIRDGWLKWLVRRSMADALPPAVAWRKRKMGFPFPYGKWAASSKATFLRHAAGLDCPYIDRAKLIAGYDELASANPLLLWRIMSVCLWWKRCVLGERLN